MVPKTLKLLALLLLVATAARAVDPKSEHALKVDATGSPTSSLNLGGSHVTGTRPASSISGIFAPSQLGTGTPTSSTVLLGSGAWGALAGGSATIAATGNLLMGDSAGNAAAVRSGADLFRALKARLETKRATEPTPANLLLSANSFSGTFNADGTITVPPQAEGGAVEWNIANPAPATTYHGYVVAVADAPSGALVIHGNYGPDFTGTDATIGPGVYAGTFTSGGSGSINVFVRNTTPTAITIYPPMLGLTDAGLSFLQSGADSTPVASPPVADLDFTRFASESADRTARYLGEKQTTLAVDSVSGLDANAGTLYAPRLTLGAQTLANGSVLGVYRGSTFRDALPLTGQGAGRGVVVQDLAFGSGKALPIVSGLDLAPNGSFSANGDGTFTYVWLPTDPAIENGGYGNVSVVEINAATEAATPLASRHRMVDANVLSTVSSQAAVAGLPGSAWIRKTGPSPNAWTAIIHPSDGLAPGSGAYRYEVVSRVSPAPWYTGNTFGDGSLSGFQLIGSGSGVGPLSGPTGFVGDRLVVAHGTTHNAVLGGGSLQRSAFYETGDSQSIMLAWYALDPTGLSWDLRHCLFYAQSPGGLTPPDFVIAHSGGSGAYARGHLSDCAFVGGRLGDGSLGGWVYGPHNVLSSVMERCYAYGVAGVLDGAPGTSVEIKNSVFRQVYSWQHAGSFHDNIVLSEPLHTGDDPTYSIANFGLLAGANVTVTNNLFWAHGLSSANTAKQVRGFSFYAAAASATHNILVLDPAPGSVGTYFQNAPPAGVALDYNLVISTGSFGANGPGAGYASWAAYQGGYPALDQHSLFVDLSGDARGLRAVFLDPANGDFRWAQTDVARRCAAFCAANHVGPATVTSHWPVVPAVDNAVRMITGL